MEENYSLFVNTLLKSGEDIKNSLSNEDANLLHLIIGLSGEAGELLDAIKKAVIYRKPLDLENVIEELGDIEFYLEGIRSALSLTRQETIQANIKKLSKRYEGLKYSDQSAQNRADKVSE